MKVKICGITNLEDALLCESFGADALGFILYENSKRFVKPEVVKEIVRQLSPFTLKVGVFVNTDSNTINDVSKFVGLNIVQLHGDEMPEQIEEINLPVIKAFRISAHFDFEVIEQYKNCYHLFDTYSSTEYGGTGKSFNWNLIPKELTNKIILSGGISSASIKNIIKEVNPLAVDISSSLELYPGKKDEQKVKDFFNNLKGAI